MDETPGCSCSCSDRLKHLQQSLAEAQLRLAQAEALLRAQGVVPPWGGGNGEAGDEDAEVGEAEEKVDYAKNESAGVKYGGGNEVILQETTSSGGLEETSGERDEGLAQEAGDDDGGGGGAAGGGAGGGAGGEGGGGAGKVKDGEDLQGGGRRGNRGRKVGGKGLENYRTRHVALQIMYAVFHGGVLRVLYSTLLYSTLLYLGLPVLSVCTTVSSFPLLRLCCSVIMCVNPVPPDSSHLISSHLISSHGRLEEAPFVAWMHSASILLPHESLTISWHLNESESCTSSARMDGCTARQVARVGHVAVPHRAICRPFAALSSPLTGGEHEPSKPPPERPSVWVLEVVGTAFLWHQIRCMMAVLLMVGRGQERPEVVSELLDVHGGPFTSKPQYAPADPHGLVLHRCTFPASMRFHCSANAKRLFCQSIRQQLNLALIRCSVLQSAFDAAEASAADSLGMASAEDEIGKAKKKQLPHIPLKRRPREREKESMISERQKIPSSVGLVLLLSLSWCIFRLCFFISKPSFHHPS
ncbi:unnamed protein product [Closterium sp. NIES-54]